jgi:hypothetical protein
MQPLIDDSTVAEVLILSGYRRVSNKFKTVARVDRPGPCKLGSDYYRRVNSRDAVTVSANVYNLMRNCRDCDYCPLHPLVKVLHVNQVIKNTRS